MCVCVCACACARIGVTGNLKRERLVSPQHDDFLCQQTVSRKIDPYYDEINFNGQGFQIFPTKSLKIRTFNDASLGSALLSSSVELFCLPCWVLLSPVLISFRVTVCGGLAVGDKQTRNFICFTLDTDRRRKSLNWLRAGIHPFIYRLHNLYRCSFTALHRLIWRAALWYFLTLAVLRNYPNVCMLLMWKVCDVFPGKYLSQHWGCWFVMRSKT